MLLGQPAAEFTSKFQLLSEAMLGRAGIAYNIWNVILLDTNLKIANLIARYN